MDLCLQRPIYTPFAASRQGETLANFQIGILARVFVDWLEQVFLSSFLHLYFILNAAARHRGNARQFSNWNFGSFFLHLGKYYEARSPRTALIARLKLQVFDPFPSTLPSLKAS